MKVALTILFAFCMFNLGAQKILTFDLETNTVRLIKIKNDKVDYDSIPDSLIAHYLDQEKNKGWKIKKMNFNTPLYRKFRVGEYVVLQINNIDKSNRIDSVYVTYSFLDNDLGQYRELFNNVLNNALTPFSGDQTASNGSGDGNGTTPTNTDPVLQGAFVGEGGRSIANFEPSGDESGDRLEFILSCYKAKTATPRDSLIESLLDSIGLDPDKDLLFASRPAAERDSLVDDFKFRSLNRRFGSYSTINEDLVDLLNLITDQSFTPDDIDILYEMALASVEEVKESESSEEISSPKRDQANDSSKVGKSVTYFPIQVPNKDLVYFHIEAFKNGVKQYERPFSLQTRFGFKIDFSAGFLATGLRDRNYFLRPVQDTTFALVDGMVSDSLIVTTKNQIGEEDNGSFIVGAGILAHFYTRFLPRFNPAFSMGFMFNQNGNLNYLAGGSIIFGEEQRWIINGGLAVGEVRRLSNLFSEEELIDSNITELPLVDEWATSWYLGASYNF